jgi:polyribonucleotide nucleotidyltransferase
VQAEKCSTIRQTEMVIDGKTIIVKTGRMAKQAHGAVEVYCGDTMVLVTCTESRNVRDGIDYFPLLVDYEEKLYSVGRVPGSFGRREGKAPDKAILTSRLIDRPIRPLFKEGYKNDVQIVATTMSADQETPPDTLAMLGASFAIELAGLPFAGPIGAVRVGRVDGNLIGNPSYAQMDESDLDLSLSLVPNHSIMMVEAGCNLVTVKDMSWPPLTTLTKSSKSRVEAQRQLLQSCRRCKVKEFVAPPCLNQRPD